MIDDTEQKIQELVIEKGLPVRERYPRNAFTNVAKKMEVGDSIFSSDARVINGILGALNKMGRSTTTRTEQKNGALGKRIWRVEDRTKDGN